MNPFYIWLGFWLYIFDRQRFAEILYHFVEVNKKPEKQAEILQFKRFA